MRETFHYAAAELWKRRDRYTCFVVLFPVYLGRINLLKIMSVVRRATRRQFCAGTSEYGWRRALIPPCPTLCGWGLMTASATTATFLLILLLPNSDTVLVQTPLQLLDPTFSFNDKKSEREIRAVFKAQLLLTKAGDRRTKINGELDIPHVLTSPWCAEAFLSPAKIG